VNADPVAHMPQDKAAMSGSFVFMFGGSPVKGHPIQFHFACSINKKV
jgi:hypothetical protein